MANLSERDRTQLQRMEHDIAAFLSSYTNNTISPAERRTVIFFTGGMASTLRRRAHPDTDLFDELWISILTLNEQKLDLLKMVDDDTDCDGGLVVADGGLRVCNYDPYGSFKAWCADQGFDLFVFGYDWRRRPDDSVRFFLDVFLPHLQERIPSSHRADPLDDLTLVGHSLGGPLIKLIVHDTCSPLVTRIKRAITVASPFYGYAGQTPRYFEGEKDFTWCDRADLAHLISTLRGGYFLQFLDAKTYEDNKVAFKNADYPITQYPSLDAENDQEYADPFDPTPDAQGKVRYPSYVATDELPRAKAISRLLAADLPESFKDRFFCMRGVQAQRKRGKMQAYCGTPARQTWQRIRADTFDPKGPCPVVACCDQGDGSEPAWTTQLLSLAKGQGFAFVGHVEHTRMMDCNPLRAKLAELIRAPDVTAHARGDKGNVIEVDDASLYQDVASKEDTVAFLNEQQRQYASGGARIKRKVEAYLASKNHDPYYRRLLMMLNHSHLPTDPPAGTRP